MLKGSKECPILLCSMTVWAAVVNTEHMTQRSVVQMVHALLVVWFSVVQEKAAAS